MTTPPRTGYHRRKDRTMRQTMADECPFCLSPLVFNSKTHLYHCPVESCQFNAGVDWYGQDTAAG